MPPTRGWHLTGMFEAMERGDLTALYVIGENPAQSEADQHHAAAHLLAALDVLVVQDVMRTATAELADVVLPAAAGAFESEGTVTSSERRVQRVRRTKAPARREPRRPRHHRGPGPADGRGVAGDRRRGHLERTAGAVAGARAA